VIPRDRKNPKVLGGLNGVVSPTRPIMHDFLGWGPPSFLG
jgi:hypothetical protein